MIHIYYIMISYKHAQQITAFLGLQPEESIVIIGDSTSQDIVKPLYELIRGSHNPLLVNLDDFSRPLANVPDELVDIVKGKDLCFYAIDKQGNKEVNEVTFRGSLNKVVEDSGGRIGNMLSVTPQIVESAFAYDAQKIKDLTERVLEYMREVPAVSVKTPEGAKATFEFDSKYKWCASTGFIERGKTRNVMPAEVYTHPITTNGKIVITGTYGYLGSLSQFKNNKRTLDRIKKNPILWVVKDGKITDVSCGDKEIKDLVIKQVFESDENANRIGEYGMGTNIGIKRCLGVMMYDEKYPGVHVAHGHGYPKETGADYDCKIHFDGVLIKPDIKDLGSSKFIMKKGNYKI